MSKDNQTKTKKPKNIKRIIIISVILVIVAFVAYKILNLSKNIPELGVSLLEKSSIAETISGNGIIESMDSLSVTSNVPYKLEDLNVKVGDVVKKGDVLCTLSKEDLEAQLAQLQATIGKAQSSANHSTKVAEKSVDKAETTSIEELEKAVSTLENQLKTAEENLEMAMSEVRKYLPDDDNQWGQIPSEDGVIKKLKVQADQAERTRDSLKIDLQKAREELVKAESGDNEAVESAQDQLDGTKIQGNLYSEYLQIEQLKKQINDTAIRAPKDGVVTMVNAKKGVPVSGVLFVIENLDDYVIEANVREYDINNLKIGTKVIIQSEATGDSEYTGEIDFISPTANKAPDGSIVTANVEFKIRIKVIDKDEDLKVGMNTRLTIIIDEKNDTFTVPLNAIGLTPEGKEFIYIASPVTDGSDKYIIKEVLVTIGIQGDLLVEILDGDFKEGDYIIENVDTVMVDMIIKPLLPQDDIDMGQVDG